MSPAPSVTSGRFPTASGVLLGLGLGGFFDGIVLHQVLEWHHMLSSWYPTNTIANLRINTLWDGIFHSTTYVFVVIGVYLLWRAACTTHLVWSAKTMWGTALLGWGAFNVVEGLVDHQLLGVHHVNELVARDQWLAWDAAFLLWGALMLVVGWLLTRAGQREQSRAQAR